MKVANINLLKTKIGSFISNMINKENEVTNIEKEIEQNESTKVIKDKVQKETPKRKIGINMTPEQEAKAEQLKQEILYLHQQGFSTRTITQNFNELYGGRDTEGNVIEIISRETIRKIIANQPVSLKSISKIVDLQK